MRLVLVPLLLAPACIFEDAAPDHGDDTLVTSGAYHHFEQREWILPTTTTEARAMAFDLDGNGVIDNEAGAVVAALGSLGLDMDAAQNEAFAGGAVTVLYSVRADSLVDDATVSWRSMNGLAPSPPRFDGTDRPTPTAEDGFFSGAIRGELLLTAGTGPLTMRVPFFPGQPAIVVPLIAARVEMTPRAGDCEGHLGGAIRSADLDGRVLPAMAAQAVEHMARHPDHEFTRTAISLFDANHDGTVSAEEIVSNSITRSLFRLDVDLDGDGEDEATSFALAFRCEPAGFTAVGE